MYFYLKLILVDLLTMKTKYKLKSKRFCFSLTLMVLKHCKSKNEKLFCFHLMLQVKKSCLIDKLRPFFSNWLCFLLHLSGKANLTCRFFLYFLSESLLRFKIYYFIELLIFNLFCVMVLQFSLLFKK